MFSSMFSLFGRKNAAPSEADGKRFKDDADAALQRGAFAEAAHLYRMALEQAQKQPKPQQPARLHANLAFALKESGDAAGAQASAQQALDLDPAMADAHYLLATLGPPDRAQHHYRAALAAAPDLEPAWVELCTLLAASGHHDEARHAAQDGLKALPQSAGIRICLGNLDYQGRRFIDAIAHFREAASLLADPAALFDNIGMAQLAGGRVGDAIASFEAALAARPDAVDSLCNLGNALDAAGRFDDAQACYARACASALESAPHDVRARFNLGNSLLRSRKLDLATQHYNEVLALDPRHFGALFQLGYIAQISGQFDTAIGHLQHALTMSPGDLDARVNLGVCLRQVKRYDEALDCQRSVLRDDPARAEACDEIGIVFQDLGDFSASEHWHREAIALDPGRVEARTNLGMALQLQGRLDEAEAAFRTAIELGPTHALAQVNLAVLLSWHLQNGEALALLDRAAELAPELTLARKNAAMLRLLCGDFEAGWRGYESRWEGASGERRMASNKPHWDGSADLSGKTILLYAEQGFGDSLQFVRYAPLAAKLGATVWLRVPPALKRLFLSCEGVARVFAEDEALPPYDFLCPLLSLPLAFGTVLATIPASVPYLHAAPADVEHWARKLGACKLPRVGIVWAGDPRKSEAKLQALYRMRSLQIDQIRPWLALPNLEFHSLQVGADAVAQLDGTMPIVHHHQDLRDFADTAALIANLDLVVSVDTSVAHLAGALGKPVWLLNRYNSDWRWLQGRDDSPWYPSMRIFRQRALGDWDGVVKAVGNALAAFDLH